MTQLHLPCPARFCPLSRGRSAGHRGQCVHWAFYLVIRAHIMTKCCKRANFSGVHLLANAHCEKDACSKIGCAADVQRHCVVGGVAWALCDVFPAVVQLETVAILGAFVSMLIVVPGSVHQRFRTKVQVKGAGSTCPHER